MQSRSYLNLSVSGFRAMSEPGLRLVSNVVCSSLLPRCLIWSRCLCGRVVLGCKSGSHITKFIQNHLLIS